MPLYPSKYPLQIFFCKGYFIATSTALFHSLNILLHPVGAVPLHLVGNVSVHIQCERRRGVSEVALDRLNIIPGTDRGYGERMPLWHNKDKSENPCVATGWLVCPYSFSTKNGSKRGLREGVKNQSCA